MKALVFSDGIEWREDFPQPAPQRNEALVRVLMAGICNTDIEIIKGYMGFSGILGHEFVGRVDEVNGSAPDLMGKRVVAEINCGCGDCDFCRQDLSRHCQARSVVGIQGRDGCFTEYVTVPLQNLHGVPEGVEDESAVFCEPLAAALEIQEQISIRPEDRILVLGDGKLGLLIALSLRHISPYLTLAGRFRSKLNIAAEKGIHTRLHPDLGSGLYDIVVEATGTFTGFETAMQKVRPRGTIVLKSTVAARNALNLAPLVINEITVVGSRCGPFPAALQALRDDIDVRPLISAVYPFDKALDALARAQEPEALKILLDMR